MNLPVPGENKGQSRLSSRSSVSVTIFFGPRILLAQFSSGMAE